MAQYDVDLRDYWRIIKKRKPIIIFSMITLMIFSFIFAQYKRSRVIDIFASSATIRIDNATASGGGSMLAAYGYNYGGSSDNVTTEIKTITSYPVMANVALRAGLLPDSLKTLPEAERDRIIQSDPFLLRTVNSLTSMVNPERFEFTNIVIVHAQDYDPVGARDLAQHVVEAYKEVRRKSLNQKIMNSIEFVQKEIDALTVKLDSVDVAIDTFGVNNGSAQPYHTEENIAADMTRTYRDNDDLEIRRQTIELMIRQLEQGGTIDDSVLSDAFAEEEGGIIRQNFIALQDMYKQRDELLTYYTKDHPDVKNLDNRIALQRKLLVKQLKSNINTIETQKQSNDMLLATLKKRFDSINRRNDSISRLVDRKRVLQENYLMYSRRLQDLQVQASENVDDVTIIEPAVINTTPVNASSSVFAISFIGLFLGTIIGTTTAFIFETLDTSIGTIEDVETFLGVPVVGLIPQISADVINSNRYTPDGESKRSYEITNEQAMMIIHYAPKSVLAESYRSLRTNIQFISYEREASVLLFTSTSPQEGKSTSIINLALTMAQSGNSVLLIDGDLRRPSVDQLFGIERERGLSEILLGKRHWKECVKTVTDIITGSIGMSEIILEPGIDNLHIITCGSIPPNPSELLSSESTDEFIADVRKEYDIVLFDCAPTLPATDSAVLGRKVDGVVFVYAVGKVSRGSLKRAKNQLDQVKATVIGVVLNGIKSELSADFQDYKYKDYYYSYDEEMVEEPSTGMGKFKRKVTDFIQKFS
ncbi:MAG: AAA family ATPase [Candidatus Latescibacteria bacterium]|nr:AAA family ATPase [Candidatus Latescibacterota bacterium]